MKNICKFSIFLILALNFFSCANLRNEQGQTRKQVRDLILSDASFDTGKPKRKVLILPPIDRTEIYPEDVLSKAYQDFIQEVTALNRMIVLPATTLNEDISKFRQGFSYDSSKLRAALLDQGVHAIFETVIVDLKVDRQQAKVGLFRQQETRFEMQIRGRLYPVRGRQDIFTNLKTMTLEDFGNRVGPTTSNKEVVERNRKLVTDLLVDTLFDFSPQVVGAMDKLGWEGRIAHISGNQIFLNVGQQTGLRVGDLLRVLEDGEEIYDPQTGNFLGKAPGKLKGTLEVISFFGTDGAIGVLHSGSGFRPLDRVELY